MRTAQLCSKVLKLPSPEFLPTIDPNMSAEIVPTAPPDLAIPESQHTVRVRAIDTTTRLVCDAHAFVEPPIAGHEKINMKTMCFLLEREGPDGLERVLFDCGSRKEYWEGSPQACRMIGGHVPSLEVEFGVDEILSKGGVPLQSLGKVQPYIIPGRDSDKFCSA